MPADPILYLNRELVPRSQAHLRPDDRGFLFGDGVYEVFRAVNGRIFAADAHLRRLKLGLAALRIQEPQEVSAGRVPGIAEEILARNDLTRDHATIYLQITRGSAERTHHFPVEDTAPTLLMSGARFVPPDSLHREGARCILQPDRRWARAHIKTVNLLPNVLAKQAAREAGAFEALFVRDGMVLEGSSSNLFAVMDGQLRTCPATNYILRGITRDVVLDLARSRGLPLREEVLDVEDLSRADELFLTGTTTDVMPVIEVDGRAVGSGRPGRLTLELQEAFLEELHRPVSGRPT